MSERFNELLSGRSASRTLLAVRLSWRDGDETPSRVAPSELAREVVVEHGGRIASISSEALLAEMGSPTDTLQCAAALQDRFALERIKLGTVVRVRTGVSAGEVMRNGRALIGDAVDHANRLAEQAAPGEVLFTHGVCLAMTRSEVTWERVETPEPGIGQPIHRLLPQPGYEGGELPFGGVGLRRSPWAFFGSAARQTGEVASSAATGFTRALAWLVRGPALLRAHLAPALTVVLLAGILVGAGVLFLPNRPASAVEAALGSGQVEAALALVDEWLAKSPDQPEPRAWRGRVLAESDRLAEARELLGAALAESPRLAHSSGVAQGMVRILDEKGADRSLILAHRTPVVEQALIDATSSPRYWMRWNAVHALEKFDLGDRVDRVSVYSLDLQHAGSCGTRVRAARELGKLGDLRAVPALEDAKAKGFPGAACNLKRAAGEALLTLGLASADG